MQMPGFWEWAMILFIVVLVFGTKRLPELGESLGKGIRNFKKTMSASDEDKSIDPKS